MRNSCRELSDRGQLGGAGGLIEDVLQLLLRGYLFSKIGKDPHRSRFLVILVDHCSRNLDWYQFPFRIDDVDPGAGQFALAANTGLPELFHDLSRHPRRIELFGTDIPDGFSIPVSEEFTGGFIHNKDLSPHAGCDDAACRTLNEFLRKLLDSVQLFFKDLYPADILHDFNDVFDLAGVSDHRRKHAVFPTRLAIGRHRAPQDGLPPPPLEYHWNRTGFAGTVVRRIMEEIVARFTHYLIASESIPAEKHGVRLHDRPVRLQNERGK